MWYVKVHRHNKEKDCVAIIFDPIEKKTHPTLEEAPNETERYVRTYIGPGVTLEHGRDIRAKINTIGENGIIKLHYLRNL